MKKSIALFIFFSCFVLFSHGLDTDSLKLELKKSKNDTARCRILDVLINELDDDKVWPGYNSQLKSICEKNLRVNKLSKPLYFFYNEYLAISLFNIGYLHSNKDEYFESLDYYEKCLKIREQLKDTAEMVNCLYSIAFSHHFLFNYDTSIAYYNKCYYLAKKINDQNTIIRIAKDKGDVFIRQGKSDKAFESFKIGLKAAELIGDKSEIGFALEAIGSMFMNMGDIPKALEYEHKSLKVFEEIDHKHGMAAALSCIGLIYNLENDHERSFIYFKRSLKKYKEANDVAGIAYVLQNIGAYYSNVKKYDEALEYYQRSLAIKKDINQEQGVAKTLNSIGQIYKNKGDLKSALAYYRQGLEVIKKMKFERDECMFVNNITGALITQGNYNEAKTDAEKNLLRAKKIGYPSDIENSSKLLSIIYYHLGNYKGAYEMQILYKQMEDSVKNEVNKKASIQKSFQYEYDKKVAADSVKVSEAKKIEQAKLMASEAKLKQEKTQRFALYGGLVLVLVFAGFIFNRFRITQKQKNIIEIKEKEAQHQKQIIEEKHKEITDSINYAERIQRSFLASKELLDNNLNNYFIFFKPKDIVSGDFYWAAELKNKCFAFMVADSTGHGVPGAIMSLLNITSLEKACEQFNEPSEILNNTRETIIKRLKKDGSNDGGKDGMDCSLMVFNFEKQEVKIASANNAVWIIRNNELIEIAADKMPVGKHDKDSLGFSQQTINLQKGDIVYALTDGFPDQFGGPKGKKFMSKNLKKILLDTAQLSLEEQKNKLEATFKNWLGNLEQVDDVCLVGVKI